MPGSLRTKRQCACNRTWGNIHLDKCDFRTRNILIFSVSLCLCKGIYILSNTENLLLFQSLKTADKVRRTSQEALYPVPHAPPTR